LRWSTEDNPSLGIPALGTHQSDLRALIRAWDHCGSVDVAVQQPEVKSTENRTMYIVLKKEKFYRRKKPNARLEAVVLRLTVPVPTSARLKIQLTKTQKKYE
jgi:hypothetical protein